MYLEDIYKKNESESTFLLRKVSTRSLKVTSKLSSKRLWEGLLAVQSLVASCVWEAILGG